MAIICMFVSQSTYILCPFVWWSARCNHKRKYKRVSWKESFLYLQNLETVDTAHHLGSGGKCQVSIWRQKTGAVESLGQSQYWGFLRKNKAVQGKHFRIDYKDGPSFMELWSYFHREIFPSGVYWSDRGCIFLDWPVCLAKECSWLSPLLSVRIGQSPKDQSLHSQKGF